MMPACGSSSVMVGSFRGAVSSWLVTTLGHDVYLTLPGVMAAKAGDGLFEAEEVEQMGAVAGVTRVVTNRHVVDSEYVDQTDDGPHHHRGDHVADRCCRRDLQPKSHSARLALARFVGEADRLSRAETHRGARLVGGNIP